MDLFMLPLNSSNHEQILDASRRHRADVMLLAWRLRAQTAIDIAERLQVESIHTTAVSTRLVDQATRLRYEPSGRDGDPVGLSCPPS